MRDNTGSVFFELLKAGLWREADANLNVNHNLFEGVEWEKIYQLAQEQSVLGLVLAGLEQYKNLNANLDLNKIGFVSPARRYEAPTVVLPPQM